MRPPPALLLAAPPEPAEEDEVPPPPALLLAAPPGPAEEDEAPPPPALLLAELPEPLEEDAPTSLLDCERPRFPLVSPNGIAVRVGALNSGVHTMPGGLIHLSSGMTMPCASAQQNSFWAVFGTG